jgi:hypothetical protein
VSDRDLHPIIELALSALSEPERRSSAVYLETKEVLAGEAVTIGRKEVTLPAAGYLVFIDPAPTANWGHPCRYLFIESATLRMHQFPAQFPPFMREIAQTLRLIWKGHDVPEAVLPTIAPFE